MEQPIKITLLSKMPVFADVATSDLSFILQDMHWRNVRSRSSLLLLDQPNENVYFVVSGSVKIYVHRKDRRALVLNLLGPGEVLGEMSATESLPASASAVTVEPSSLLYMNGADFARNMRRVPQMLLNLLSIQNRRMRRLTTRTEAITSMDVPQRVAQQLISFALDYGIAASDGVTASGGIAASQCVTLPLKIKQTDLGGLVGASREEVNRVLSAYQNEGLIHIAENSYIQLLDLEALRQQAAT